MGYFLEKVIVKVIVRSSVGGGVKSGKYKKIPEV